MLKMPITYTDFNDQEVTEEFWFHLSKPELIELEVDVKGGFSNLIKEIVAAEDRRELIITFKKIILMSYGRKSEDGKRFVKSETLREEFSQSAAYHKLFMDLTTDENAAAKFIQGVMPKDLVGVDQDKPTALPTANA